MRRAEKDEPKSLTSFVVNGGASAAGALWSSHGGRYANRVVLRDPWAEVRIHMKGLAQQFTGPDTFLLKSVGAETKAEARFWVERAVSEATEVEPGVWSLAFGRDDNEGGGGGKPLSLQAAYQLVHRPGGTEQGARVVFTEEKWYHIFNQDFEGEAASEEADAKVKVAAHFLPVRFLEGARATAGFPMRLDGVTVTAKGAGMPSSSAEASARPEDGPPGSLTSLKERIGDAGVVQRWLYVFSLQRRTPKTVFDLEAGRHKERPPDVPFEVALEGVWQVGGDGAYRHAPYPARSGGQQRATDEKAPSLPSTCVPEVQGPPAGHILLQNAVADRSADEEATHVIKAASGGRHVVHVSPFALPFARLQQILDRLESGWTLQRRGTGRASSEEGSEEVPEGEGRAQQPTDGAEQVFLEGWECIESTYEALRENLSTGQAPRPVPRSKRAAPQREGRDVFLESLASRFTPGPYAFGDYRWNRQEGHVEAYVPAPLRVAEHRAEIVQEAARAMRRWHEKIGGARRNGALVGAPCYKATHGRAYLQEGLAAATKSVPRNAHDGGFRVVYDADSPFNMAEAWDRETRKQYGIDGKVKPREPEGIHYLAHFRYAARCQGAALKAARQEAARRLAAWLTGPAVLAAARDCYAAEAAGGGAASAEAVRTTLFACFAQVPDGGAGGDYLAGLIKEAGLAAHAQEVEEAARRAGGEAAYEEILAPLEARDWLETLEGPAFNLLWTLSQETPGAALAWARATATAATAAVAAAPAYRSARAPAVLAAALMSSARWQSGARVTVHRRAPGGTPTEATVQVGRGLVVEQHHVALRYRTGRVSSWRVRFTGAAVAQQYEAVLEGTADALAGTNAVLVSLTTALHLKDGEADLGDALAVGQSMTDAADLLASRASDGTRALRIARRVARLGPWLDVAGGVVGVYNAANNRQDRGQQTRSDPEYLGMLAEAAAATGGGMLSVGAAPLVALALIGTGLVVSWVLEAVNAAQTAAADPLMRWLSDESLWGKDRRAAAARAALQKKAQRQTLPPSQRRALEAANAGTTGSRAADEQVRSQLFQLVVPGQGATSSEAFGSESPLHERIKEETGRFLETAYTFPTDVSVRAEETGANAGPGTVAPTGLALRIAPGYVPAYGTFMVEARVMPVGSAALRLKPANIHCAVHFVSVEAEGFRYCVEEAGGKGLNLDLADGKTLAEWAEGTGHWAESKRVALPVEGGRSGAQREEKEALLVHVGAGWEGYRRTKRERRQLKMRVQRRNAFDREVGPFMGAGGLPGTERLERAAAEMQARVGRRSLMRGSKALDAVLHSGRFRVTGFVYFNPLVPFDPAPDFPENHEEVTETIVAFEQIGGAGGYTYPAGNDDA